MALASSFDPSSSVPPATPPSSDDSVHLSPPPADEPLASKQKIVFRLRKLVGATKRARDGGEGGQGVRGRRGTPTTHDARRV